MAGRALTLDLYRPDPMSAPTPLVVWIHGARGAEANKATTPAAALATPGYAVASIEYRSAPGTPIAAQVADAKAAVRWLRANASRFNLDPSKVGVFGHDSGATIAAILGTAGDVAALEGDVGTANQSSRVQAVVALAPPVDRAQAVNPLAYVTKEDAPTLLLHGTADTVVPTLQSQALISALKVAGVNATLELQIGVPHDLNRLLSPLAMQLVNGFFDQHLRGVRRPAGTSTYLSTPWTEYIDPVAIDLGGALYKTYPTPVRGARHRRQLPHLPAAGLRDERHAALSGHLFHARFARRLEASDRGRLRRARRRRHPLWSDASGDCRHAAGAQPEPVDGLARWDETDGVDHHQESDTAHRRDVSHGCVP